jgi:hypothetical protein
MEKKLTPKTANTFNRVCKLKRDNVSTRNSWLSVDGTHVSIYNQKNGESSTGNARLSKKEFERFIRFYETGE